MARTASIRRTLALATAGVIAAGTPLAAVSAAVAAPTPVFTVEAHEVPHERVDLAIDGSGFDDVKAVPGQTEPHVYFTLIEKDADLSEVSDTDTAISASVEPDGTLSDTLSVPADELAEGTAYEVISWPSRSFPSETNLYARADADIDWAALFPSDDEQGGEDAVEDGDGSPDEDGAAENGASDDGSGSEDPADDAPGSEDAAEDGGSADDGADDAGEDATPEGPGTDEGTLTWGISERWRSYITGRIARGEILAVDPAVLRADQTVTWVNGTGDDDLDLEAGTGAIQYEGGIIARGHPGHGGHEWALNQTLSDLRVELTSPTSGVLSAEVVQPLTEYAPEYTGERIEIVDLSFEAGDLDDGQVRAKGVFTEDGADIYSRMNEDFQPGAPVDDVVFSIGAPAEQPDPQERTSIALATSRTTASAGDEITLSAKAEPAVAGVVSFWNGDSWIGREIPTRDGRASVTTTSLSAGEHALTARFAPADDAYAPSVSDPVTVSVVASSGSGGGSGAEGSIRWGVKQSFRDYVVGGIAKGRITAAKGATQASGNGIFTYPQASGGTTWNGRTGVAQYAGQVTFFGHDGALNHTIANPRIRVMSDTRAVLEAPFRGKTIAFAAIDLAAGVTERTDGDGLSVRGARTTLTKAGTVFFSYEDTTFYGPGTELDPISFAIGEASDVATSEPPRHAGKPGGKGASSGDPAPAATPASDGSAAGSLRWPISSAFVAYTTCDGKERFGYSHCANGSISTSGVGSGYRFPQASGGDWDPETQTGTVAYSGVVSFRGYGMTMFSVANPQITIDGPDSATLRTGNTASFGAASYPLDLSGATKTKGDDGSVTWSGVRVGGSLTGGPGGGSSNSVGFDDLAFTVGSPSDETFGDTSDGEDDGEEYEAAATPPATSGLDVLTPADRIREGGRIQVQATGFEADDRGILVVLYETGSDAGPIVLDDGATADEDGRVRWSGTLPDDGTGAHVLTLQGSADAGAEIDILERADETASAEIASAPVASAPGAAPVAAAAAPPLTPAGGMALWEWWVIAASLVAIAGCTSALAVRQRVR